MPDTKIDQQAVADKLGISRSTVTRVLRHDPTHRIAPETKQLILHTAKQMGYRPRRRRTGNIAFVVCGEMASMQSELHMATCDEAARHDYRVFLVRMPSEPSYKQLSLYINPLAADGAVVVGNIREEVGAMLASVMPLVILDNDKIECVDSVTVDYVELGYKLTKCLTDAGHRNIAVIAQFPHQITWAGQIEGFRRAMESAGLEADLAMVHSKYRKLYPVLLADILSRNPKPTGILALTTSDHSIILSTLLAMGISVPCDLSYVGWAYSYMSALLPFPAVTCLDGIYQSMAGTAVRRLLERTEDQDLTVLHSVVPVKLRIGETCTCAS